MYSEKILFEQHDAVTMIQFNPKNHEDLAGILSSLDEFGRALYVEHYHVKKTHEDARPVNEIPRRPEQPYTLERKELITMIQEHPTLVIDEDATKRTEQFFKTLTGRKNLVGNKERDVNVQLSYLLAPEISFSCSFGFFGEQIGVMARIDYDHVTTIPRASRAINTLQIYDELFHIQGPFCQSDHPVFSETSIASNYFGLPANKEELKDALQFMASIPTLEQIMGEK